MIFTLEKCTWTSLKTNTIIHSTMKPIRFYSLTSVLCFTLILLSCQDTIDGEEQAGKLRHMTIEEAKSLFIATHDAEATLYGVKCTPSLRSTADSGEQMYEVEYRDHAGKKIRGIIPFYVRDLGDYLFMIFREQGSTGKIYLVRKSDGKASEIPEEYIPSLSGNNEIIYNKSVNRRSFRPNYIDSEWDFLDIVKDRENNLYYTAIRCNNSGLCPHILYRASPAPGGEFTYKPLSVENETVWGFCVDGDGNVLYGLAGGRWMRSVRADGVPGELIPTVRKTNGDSPVYVCNFVWSSTEGIMALYSFMGDYDEKSYTFTPYHEPRHFLMTLKNGQFEKVREINLPFTNNFPTSTNLSHVAGKVIYSHYHGGVTTLIDLSSEEFYRETPCPVQANMVINNLLYHFDKNGLALTRVDIEDGTTTHIYKLDRARLEGYTVAHILDVSETCILLGAYRMSDKHYLLMRMNVDNEITILKDIPGGGVSLFTSLD